MIIIPEIETVVILVPRTGSGTLRRAIAAQYPKSMLLYRHMEADGVPAGYDRWPRFGVVRDPVDRLWSLYKFLRGFGGDHDPAYIAAMRASVDRPFADWVVNNETVFTSPYDRTTAGRYWPQFTVRHPIPENRKSQFVYLRPDLGTKIYPYVELRNLAMRLGLANYFDAIAPQNETSCEPQPDLKGGAWDYVSTQFAWDFLKVETL